ncbi:uncharacterized protein LOC134539012 [Bacillus rossius redtenbacheri]|uniref:uncharacterized protein LOC134539012 n=1 Tax=Bacillus rossius redtenbacheri TaxID=93214 RepID=UPI002FDC7F5C
MVPGPAAARRCRRRPRDCSCRGERPAARGGRDVIENERTFKGRNQPIGNQQELPAHRPPPGETSPSTTTWRNQPIDNHLELPAHRQPPEAAGPSTTTWSSWPIDNHLDQLAHRQPPGAASPSTTT